MGQDKSNTDKSLLVIVMIDSTIQAALIKVGPESEVVSQSELRTFGSEKEFVVVADQCLQELGEESEGVNETICLITSEWMAGDDLNLLGQMFLQNLQKQLGLELVGFLNIVEAAAASLVAEKSRLLVLITETKGIAAILNEDGLGRQYSFNRDSDSTDLKSALESIKANIGETEIQDLVIVSPIFGQTKIEQEKANISDVVNEIFDQVLPTFLLSRDKTTESLLQQAGGAITGVEPSSAELNPEMGEQNGEVSDAVLINGEDENLESDEEVTEAERTEKKDTEYQGPDNNLAKVDLDKENSRVPKDKTTATSFGIPVSMSRLDSITQKDKTGGIERGAEEVRGPKIHLLAKQKMKKLWMMIGLAVLAGLIAAVAIGWFYLSQNTRVLVDVTLATKQLNESTIITIDPSRKESDPENNILVADVIEEAATDSASIQTTGVKIVGEKATGRMVIYNKSTQEKTFDVGTSFKKGEFEFVLSESVKVEAASESASEKKYGKKETSVIATKIGVEHNIGKDVEFSVSSFSGDTYSAASVDPFTGGASREIRVVAPEDLKKLKDVLKLDLTGITTKALEAKSTNGDYVLPTGKIAVVTEIFDAEEGDETDELNLKLGVVAQGIVYKTQDLLPLAIQIITSSVPEGYKLSEQPPQVLSNPIDQANTVNAFKLEVDISAKAIPIVQVDELKQAIIGRGPSDIEGILKEKSVIKDVQVKILPNIGQYVFSTITKFDQVEIVIKE